jgi:hypothetical protein
MAAAKNSAKRLTGLLPSCTCLVMCMVPMALSKERPRHSRMRPFSARMVTWPILPSFSKCNLASCTTRKMSVPARTFFHVKSKPVDGVQLLSG